MTSDFEPPIPPSGETTVRGQDAAITVAIPTYNGSRHLDEAIRSILAQSEVPFHLILSDDRSDDDTVERATRLAGDRIQVEVNSERLGLAGNWNRCVERVLTPFITIFHQDDVMRAGHLASHLLAYERSPGDCALVASAVSMIDESGRPIPSGRIEAGGLGPVDRLMSPGEALAELSVANPLRCSAVSLRVESHRRIGGFRPELRYVVDWDHWIRLARVGSVAWLAEPSVEVRWHLASETHAFKHGTADLEETSRLLEALYQAEPSLKGDSPKVNRRLARAYLNRAYEAAVTHDRRLIAQCLERAWRLSPLTLTKVAADPRFLGRLLVGSVGRSRTGAVIDR